MNNNNSGNNDGGDCAKLRETLEHIVNERSILDFCHNNLGSKTPEDWDKVYMTLRKWIGEAMSALATPATAENSSAVGNAAKLREALSKFCAYSAVVLNTGMFNRVHLEALLNTAKAALAAPLRNCEKYATVDEAMEDFADEALIEEWNALKAGKDRDMLAVELFVFTKWLFALATETKGGNDGN